jgi:hypothetical protein
MGYVAWFNQRCQDVEITADKSHVTSADFEAAHCRQTVPAVEAVTQQPWQT